MNFRTIVLIFLSLTLILAFQNCGPRGLVVENGMLFKSEGTSSGNPSKVTFAQVSAQVFQPKCVSCHDSGKSAVRYDSYNATLEKGNLSSLGDHYAEGSNPNSVCTQLSDGEMDLVLTWIRLGAPE